MCWMGFDLVENQMRPKICFHHCLFHYSAQLQQWMLQTHRCSGSAWLCPGSPWSADPCSSGSWGWRCWAQTESCSARRSQTAWPGACLCSSWRGPWCHLSRQFTRLTVWLDQINVMAKGPDSSVEGGLRRLPPVAHPGRRRRPWLIQQQTSQAWEERRSSPRVPLGAHRTGSRECKKNRFGFEGKIIIIKKKSLILFFSLAEFDKKINPQSCQHSNFTHFLTLNQQLKFNLL